MITLLYRDVGALMLLSSLYLSSPFSTPLTCTSIPPTAHCSAYFSRISTPVFLSKLSAFTSVCHCIPLLLHFHPFILTMYDLAGSSWLDLAFMHYAINMQLKATVKLDHQLKLIPMKKIKSFYFFISTYLAAAVAGLMNRMLIIMYSI